MNGQHQDHSQDRLFPFDEEGGTKTAEPPSKHVNTGTDDDTQSESQQLSGPFPAKAAQDTEEQRDLLPGSEEVPARSISMTITFSGPTLDINGEQFRVRREDEKVVISHDRWSLVGIGDTLLEAKQALYEEARALSEVYLSRPPSEMTDDALDMRDFIAQVLPHASS